jgi:hypothetical protein
VGQFEVDGSAGEHDEAEGGVGGVEPVGAAHEEPDPVVEAFDAAVGQPKAEGIDDVFAAPQIRHQVRSFDSLPLLRPLELRRAA